jgi:acetyl esterase/lipase
MMKPLILAFCVAFAGGRLPAQTNVWQPSPGHFQIPIWPGTPPDAESQHVPGPEYVTNTMTSMGTPLVWVRNVSQPTLTVYSPPQTNTGVAMVVFPGGGYNALAMDLEGTEICDWLTSRGITAILLKYRVPLKKTEPYTEPLPLALEDAQRTLGLVRFHAAEWRIDPHKIGVIGFSAGGHMVAATSTHFDQRLYPAVDAADQESCRPDFAIACYPGHLYNDDYLKLNPNVPVTTNTPPTFIVQAENDHVDGVEQALTYYIALKDVGVPVEMHLYTEGGHGFGLRRTKLPVTGWPQLVQTWLGTIGMISE